MNSTTMAMNSSTPTMNNSMNSITMMKKMKTTLKIACCSTPHSGHMNPIMSLVKGLVSKRDDINNEDYDYEICIFTFGEDGNKKYQKQCDELNVDIIVSHIPDMHTHEEMIILAKGKIPFPILSDKWESTLDQQLNKFSPDIIVCDVATLNPQEYARKHNITLVINTPGPMAMIIPTFTEPVNLEGNGVNGFAFAFGGMYISFKKIDIFGFLSFFNLNDLGNMTKRVRLNVFGNNNAIVLVNSFWGLEEPRLFVPPNIMMMGPIMPPLPNKPDFSLSHPELHTFLTKARKEYKKVLLVTTGSMIRMEEWLVQLLYNAFCNLNNCVIVWSLKQEQQAFIDLSACDDKNIFHFSSWLPQPSLLASDYIDGVITHCGWGGTLECIAGGKPIGVLPFFADQPDNAKLLLDTGCATSLGPIPKFCFDSSGRSSYKNDGISITQEGITEGCHRLLEEPKYSEKAKRLQSLACDNPNMGCNAACDQIILALHNGVSHLCDSKKYLQLTGHRPFAFTFILALIAIAAAYGAVTAYISIADYHTPPMVEEL